MLRSLRQLHGHQLGATDGDIGHVKDFYVDDRHWAVRFVVVDTGSWLSGRQVLISPHAFPTLDHTGKRLLVALTKAQIEGSPAIETRKPVSRQFEAEYYGYYGLPFYWQGDGMWGTAPFPVATSLPVAHAAGPVVGEGAPAGGDDPHLRSTQAVSGYSIQASDGEIGHIRDFLMDDASWAIRQLVVTTGGWFSGKEVLIPIDQVAEVSYADSTVRVTMTRESILQSPIYHQAAESPG